MEIIDLYDKDGNSLNKTFIRKHDTLLDDEYYLLVQCWVVNSKGQILLTQRNFDKSYGGKWEPTTGHVISGENALDAMKRELFEEVSITSSNDDFTSLESFIRGHSIVKPWFIKKDVLVKELVLQDDEVNDAKWVDIDEFRKMLNSGEVVESLSYFLDVFEKIKY